LEHLKGKVALITGGGTGIGRATALLFAEEGADVIVNYSRSKDDAEATAKDVEKLGRKSMAIKADVSNDSEARSMVDTVVKEFGRLDILVNNAGYTREISYQDLDGVKEEDWDKIFSINVKGTFNCSRAAIKVMKKQGSGHIINTTSIAGYLGFGSSIPYSASKAALINMTKGLALTQAPEIQVNSVAPGFVKTRWTAGFDKKFEQGHAEATPMRRVATPEDIAKGIFSMVINTFVTGKTLIVDGGRLLK
jgi:3-oxoacyl-[acyl-carrier protein] reductase